MEDNKPEFGGGTVIAPPIDNDNLISLYQLELYPIAKCTYIDEDYKGIFYVNITKINKKPYRFKEVNWWLTNIDNRKDAGSYDDTWLFFDEEWMDLNDTITSVKTNTKLLNELGLKDFKDMGQLPVFEDRCFFARKRCNKYP